MNWTPKPGEKNPNAKLNWAKVRKIRKIAEEAEARGEKKSEVKRELSRIYGVALRTVSAVVKGEHWREDGSQYMPDFKW